MGPIRRVGLVLLLLALAGGLLLLLRSAPLVVETAAVERGPLLVTVDEEGVTRVRERFVVAAPTPGRVLRIDLEAGDPVAIGQVVAELHPAPLDRRTRAGAQAHVEAAEANLQAANAAVVRAEAALAQAVREAHRMERLHGAGTAAEEQLERSKLEETTRTQELSAVRSSAHAAQHDLEAARAALLAGVGDEGAALAPSTCGSGESCIEVRSPVAGRVLRVPERSERVVAAGAPLLEIGDPGALEVVVDVLSSDAVNVRPGARLLLERWGGGEALAGRVRRVEPSGFKKISTLGVEEQRVNVIGDLDAPPESLGDGFRVEARIVISESADVLRIPVSALFRHADGFAVFVEGAGRARRIAVDVGGRGSGYAEIRSGLTPGQRVILHPSDRVEDGVRVREERGSSQPDPR
jgi:HlyD family secretion protein